MSFIDKLTNILNKYQNLGEKLMNPDELSQKEFIKISKEYSDLEELKDLSEEYLKIESNVKDLKEMLEDDSLEKDYRDIATQDLIESNKALENLQGELKLALLPKDNADEKDAIIEIRAGTGGEEAALFAAVLFEMYQRYAERKGWKFEELSKSETGLDGYKEASAMISGNNVFAHLKFESGVHRVQRIPETESSGRIHTSAATVAILPQAEEVDVEIEEKDLRIDLFRASGAGGQHVNTTDSAVRITHIPTGTVVSIQDEKSQHKNRAKAMKILRSRIYENQRQKLQCERAEMRKGMVGSGDRSERIRTYNYPQNRLSDHRINLTLYQLESIVSNGDLDEVIKPLIAEDRAQKFALAEA